jgi:hypothetical protein
VLRSGFFHGTLIISHRARGSSAHI